MNIRDKIHQYVSMAGVKLFSQIPVSDDEYQSLLKYTRAQISGLYMQTIAPADALISTALVQIAIRSYSDGNYWDYFLDEIGIDVSASKRNYLGQIFVSTIRRYHMFEIERTQGAKYAYVENIKAHAFVPNNYLKGYFDFLFAFYDRNILRQLPDDIEEDFQEMSEFFSSTLRESGDSFSLTNLDNKPAKSYKLLKATRTLFAQGDSETVSSEIYRHLKMIDEYYYDDKLPDKTDRFGEAFCLWEKKNTEISDKTHSTNKRRSGAFYHKPYFCVNREAATAELIIPEQKIRNEDFSGQAFAIISADGVKKSYPLSLYRAFGVIVSEQLKIPITNVFSHFEVIIKSAAEKRFEIPARDYRIFDTESIELQKLRSGQNYLLVRKTAEVRGQKATYVNTDLRPWDEYSFASVGERTVIYINNSPISMTGAFADGPDFEYVSREYMLFSSGRQVQTAYRHPTLSARVAKATFSGAFLWCNGQKYLLDDIASSVVDLPDDPTNYGVTVLLDDLFGRSEGLYRVQIDEPAKMRRDICQYVFLPALRCFPEKRRFVFDSEAAITITGGYTVTPINAISVDDDGNTYLVDLKQGYEYGEFGLSLNGEEFTIRVPLQVFKHGFEKRWQCDRPEYLWAADLKNDLYISMPGAVEATVYIGKRPDVSASGTALGDGVFRFEISSLVEDIRNSKQPFSHINLKYKDNKERTLSLYRVLNRLYIEKTDVVFDGGKVYVDVKYQGKNDLLIRFCEEGSEEVVEEETVLCGRNEFRNLTPDGLYTMYTYEVESDPFGFASEMRSIRKPLHKIGAVNYHDLSNCRINIQKILFAGKELHLNYTYSVFSLEKQDDCTYLGALYERKIATSKETKQKYVLLAKPILVECIVENDEVSVVSIQTEYEDGVFDPLYYDSTLKKLTRSDLVRVNQYERYIALYDDSTEYQINYRRVE